MSESAWDAGVGALQAAGIAVSAVDDVAGLAVMRTVAMLANEVTPVLKALRSNGLNVVAIHHHMTGTQPTIYFLHYWGTGPTEKLATGFKAALNQLGKSANSGAKHTQRQ